MEEQVIDIGKDFSEFPAGRFASDGKFSGEKFREKLLLPALEQFKKIRILLDGTKGYGSSFLEEAFGGLVRKHDYSSDELLTVFEFESQDKSLIEEIQEYLSTAKN